MRARMLLRAAWLDLMAIPGTAMAVVPLLVGRRPVRGRARRPLAGTPDAPLETRERRRATSS